MAAMVPSSAMRPISARIKFAASMAPGTLRAAPTPNHWSLLCALIGRVELIDDPRTYDNIARLANRALVLDAISEWTRTHTKAQIVEELGGRVPVGPVNKATDIFGDEHVRARTYPSHPRSYRSAVPSPAEPHWLR